MTTIDVIIHIVIIIMTKYLNLEVIAGAPLWVSSIAKVIMAYTNKLFLSMVIKQQLS